MCRRHSSSIAEHAAAVSRDWTRSFADRLETVRDLLGNDDDDEAVWEYMTHRGDLGVLDAAVGSARVVRVRHHVIECLRASQLPFRR